MSKAKHREIMAGMNEDQKAYYIEKQHQRACKRYWLLVAAATAMITVATCVRVTDAAPAPAQSTARINDGVVIRVGEWTIEIDLWPLSFRRPLIWRRNINAGSIGLNHDSVDEVWALV